MIRTITALLLLLTSAATAQVMPKIPTEEEKILALKLAYELNGKSMVRWGSIDLTGPAPITADEMIGPPPPPAREIPLDQDRRKRK